MTMKEKSQKLFTPWSSDFTVHKFSFQSNFKSFWTNAVRNIKGFSWMTKWEDNLRDKNIANKFWDSKSAFWSALSFLSAKRNLFMQKRHLQMRKFLLSFNQITTGVRWFPGKILSIFNRFHLFSCKIKNNNSSNSLFTWITRSKSKPWNPITLKRIFSSALMEKLLKTNIKSLSYEKFNLLALHRATLMFELFTQENLSS